MTQMQQVDSHHNDELQTDSRILSKDEHWALVKSANTKALPQHGTPPSSTRMLYLIWIADTSMTEIQQNNCGKLNGMHTEISGLSMHFKADPVPGFALTFRAGWEPTSDTELSSLFKKLLWEIERVFNH